VWCRKRGWVTRLRYHVYFTSVPKGVHVLAESPNHQPVAIACPAGEGFAVFLPFPQLNATPEDEARLQGVLLSAAAGLARAATVESPPEWAQRFKIPGVSDYERKIAEIETELAEVHGRLQSACEERDALLGYRRLLYAKGRALEEAVISALTELGFSAQTVGKGRHDVVFESAEGRGIAEVEGKDAQPIRLAKVDQLNRVVQEDFETHDEPAHGVLIGNAFRLSEPEKRQEPFTDDAKKAASRFNHGLLSTAHLFEALVVVLGDPNNEELRASLRAAVLDSAGKEIRFELPDRSSGEGNSSVPES
jgi:hypothetical protein